MHKDFKARHSKNRLRRVHAGFKTELLTSKIMWDVKDM